ncbi:MAG: hypothetical protein WC773_00800 [Patescibacteria group bacterium]|jgi:ubiquinone biosynthesis protein UbiJ
MEIAQLRQGFEKVNARIDRLQKMYSEDINVTLEDVNKVRRYAEKLEKRLAKLELMQNG